MPKPVLFAVDDDTTVLDAVGRDLRRAYGDRYRVLQASSGAEALEALKELKLRNQPVAMLLVDQRMPTMSGVELLTRGAELAPGAKKLLLTAYADSEAAIRAINDVALDYYLMKPWHPPEERLYPVLDELLDDWLAEYVPSVDGLTVIGHRWSAPSHHVRDFLVRNLIPYRWLDAEEDGEAHHLLELAGADAARLPVVLLPDGSHLVTPTNRELAERVGLRTQPDLPSYDLVIVGAGPAGLAAAVYGASEGLHTLLVEGEAPGGQAGTSSRIENYLGFPSGLSGGELARRAVTQARRFGAEILTPQKVAALQVKDPHRIVTLADGSELTGRALLISTGVSYRTLDAPGVDRLTGSGVYYGAAITEALMAKGQDVYIVGAGNSAGQAAMYLAQFARRVTMLVRGTSLAASMSSYLIAQLEATDNIALRPRVEVAEVHGAEHIEGISVRDLDDGGCEKLEAAGLFIFIGAAPHTDWVADVVERDARGFIYSGTDLDKAPGYRRKWTVKRDPFWLETSVPGVFVAGDVRHRSVKRIASAVGEGAMAVQFIHEHLRTV